MSKGKKWKMTKKHLHKCPHHRNWSYRIGGGRSGKLRFGHFRHKKWFKSLDGHVSMRCAMSREIWYWD